MGSSEKAPHFMPQLRAVLAFAHPTLGVVAGDRAPAAALSTKRTGPTYSARQWLVKVGGAFSLRRQTENINESRNLRQNVGGKPLSMAEGDPVVVLCPGQGAQTVGQGRAWYDTSSAARGLIQRADRYLGRSRLPNGQSLIDIMFNGPKHVLDRTDVAQPAIFVTSLACWAGLEQFELAPGMRSPPSYTAATAGLSLGEYTALVLAGALDFEAALELVTIRGDAMQQAADSTEGTMVALLGASEEQMLQICEACRKRGEVLVPANFNAPGQVVLSGSKEACQRAMAYATDKLHLKATELSVAGAFHSPLMQPAADRLADALQSTEINVPLKYSVMCNVTGRAHENDKDAIRQRLIEQLTAPVRWQACIQNAVIDHGDRTCFLELAPGRTLAGLLKRIDRKRAITNHDAPAAQAAS